MKLLRTIKDIRNDPRVTDLYYEADNGWWVDMHPGWCWAPETHLIHEQTIKEVCLVLNDQVIPCDCVQCQEFPMRRDGELQRAVDNYDAMRRDGELQRAVDRRIARATSDPVCVECGQEVGYLHWATCSSEAEFVSELDCKEAE